CVTIRQHCLGGRAQPARNSRSAPPLEGVGTCCSLRRPCCAARRVDGSPIFILMNNATPESATLTRRVTDADTAAQFGAAFPPAASTPFVLGLAAVACHEAVSPSLDA